MREVIGETHGQLLLQLFMLALKFGISKLNCTTIELFGFDTTVDANIVEFASVFLSFFSINYAISNFVLAFEYGVAPTLTKSLYLVVIELPSAVSSQLWGLCSFMLLYYITVCLSSVFSLYIA